MKLFISGIWLSDIIPNDLKEGTVITISTKNRET